MAGIACLINGIAEPWNRKGPALLGFRRRCHKLSGYSYLLTVGWSGRGTPLAAARTQLDGTTTCICLQLEKVNG